MLLWWFIPLRSARCLPSSCLQTAIVWSSDELTSLRLSTALICIQSQSNSIGTALNMHQDVHNANQKTIFRETILKGLATTCHKLNYNTIQLTNRGLLLLITAFMRVFRSVLQSLTTMSTVL